ncbi:MAG TPA: hypothetical protein VNW97_12810 [Candidatus Saccharimonadales bacterium]|nr:hypothetical protein [Candidatus Saccharimonadales bacterium]
MITKEEAVSIFSKLQSDESTVLCLGTLWGWNLLFRGTITSVSGFAVHLSSLDESAGIDLRLDLPDMGLEYGEPKDMPPPLRDTVPERSRDAATVFISLPLRVPLSFLSGPLRVPERETLMIIEERS